VFGVLLFSPGTMNPTKRLTGVCSECGGSIHFRADLIGTMTACPHCGKQTELMLAAPPGESSVPRRIVVVAVTAIVIMVAGLVVVMVGLRHFEKAAKRQMDRVESGEVAANAARAKGFEVSAISLAKGDGTNAAQVLATVVNISNRSRSQVRVEFQLFGAVGQGVGVARAYRPVLKAGAKWEIKVATEGAGEAVSARLISISAGQ
jgi:hypothetical protein